MLDTVALKKYAAGCSWSLGARIAALLTLFALNVLLTRALSPSEMGAFVLAQSLVALGALSAQLGLPQTLVRMIAGSLARGEEGRVPPLVGSALKISAVAALVPCAFLASFRIGLLPSWGPLAPCLKDDWPLLLLWVPVLAWQGVLGAAFRGLGDLRRCAVFEGTLPGVLFLVLLLALQCARLSLTLTHALSCAVLAGCAGVAFGWRSLRAVLRVCATERSRSGEGATGEYAVGWRGLLRASFPILIAAWCSLALNQADLWVIGAFGSTADVALYNSASKVAQLVSLVLVALNLAVSPLIAEMSVQGRTRELELLLRGMSTLALLPAALLVLVLALWGDGVLETVFGAPYRGGGGILLVLSLGQLVNVWTGACGTTLAMTGEQNALMMLTIVSTCTMALAALLLVQRLGVLGVALASSLGIVLQNLSALLLVKRRSGIWTHARVGVAFPLTAAPAPGGDDAR